MPPRNNSLIDSDFEDDDIVNDRMPDFGDDQVIDIEDSRPDNIRVDVIDDTPEADREKWNADKDPVEDEETEQEKYSKRVRDRLSKETAKVHAERRAKEDRERQLSEAVEFTKKLLSENNQLKGLIENGEKVLVNESSGRLEGQIAAAKAAYREAMEAGDVSGQLAAQENLTKAVAERDRLSTHRPQALPRMDEKELDRFTAQQPRQDAPTEDALAWQDKNKWFGRDEAMTAFALAFHKKLVTQEGIVPTDGEAYYKRIDNEMRRRFPERFQNSGSASPRRSDNVVAPVSRTGGSGTARKVTLTESQARLAKRLGLTLEQYAQQLVAESGQKEWVHGKS